MPRTRTVLAILLVLQTGFLSAQSGSELFETNSAGVVYIQQAVKILPEYFSDLKAVGALERSVERTILNTYLPIGSGSGFFIGQDGHLITNNHVIDTQDLKKYRERAGQSWGRYIDDSVKDTDLNADGKRALKVALFKAVTQGPFALQVLVSNKDFYDATVVASNEKLDLALVKIELHGYQAMRLAPNDSLKVGDDLYSIGYPFGSDVVKKFQELSAAFTKGAVSAFREEKWIQHTATINPGNSGGPLLDATGRVVGVNSALRTNANNTYFAIPISTVREFLSANNLASLAPESAVAGTGLATKPGPILHQNSLGEYEVSSDLIFHQEKGAQVWIDGVLAGTTPLFLNPVQSVFDVKIEGAGGRTEGRLRILKSLQGSTEVLLPWTAYTAKATFTASQQGAQILLDGKPIGASPLTVEVPVGQHTVTAEAYRWTFPKIAVSLARGEEKSLAIEGESQVPIGVMGKGTRPVLTAVDGARTLTIQPTDDFALPSGSWTVSWTGNDGYDDGQLKLELGYMPSFIDLLPFVAHGNLVFKNLDAAAKVYLDGELVSAQGLSAPLVADVGAHRVYVAQRGYQPFSKEEVLVTKGQPTELTVERQVSRGTWGMPTLWTGAGVAVLGASLAAYGLYQFSDSVALKQTSNYNAYSQWKSNASAVYWGGFATASIGVAAAVIGFVLNMSLDWDENPPPERKWQ